MGSMKIFKLGHSDTIRFVLQKVYLATLWRGETEAWKPVRGCCNSLGKKQLRFVLGWRRCRATRIEKN